MCGVCGCGVEEHEHVGADGRVLRHSHGPPGGEAHHHPHPHPAGAAEAPVAVRGETDGRLVKVERDLLEKNREHARRNRARFREAGTFVVNLMSSPGAGKTTLLTRTLGTLGGRLGTAVIEGDQQTSLDADRIRATGAPAVQINTGKACHLDAEMVGRALDRLPLPRGILFVENVGNLVCPAAFDLGEDRRVVVASVTEGEDKPLKYPDIFALADAVVVTKTDLLPHLSFDVAALEANLRRLRPGLPLFRVSATTGAGVPAWVSWLEEAAAGRAP